jgi:hypothetical protein
MLRISVVCSLATLFVAGQCFAAGPLIVDLDAQADVIADQAFKTSDINRSKTLSDKEQKRATQELLKRFIADGKKLRADGLAMAQIAAMINDGKPDTNDDDSITLEEFREFVRDAWTQRLEIMMGPRPAPEAQPVQPLIVVAPVSKRDDDDDRWRELDRRERQRLLQLEWERRQRDNWERWNNPPNSIVTNPGPSGPNRANGREDVRDDRSAGNDRAERERPERREQASKPDSGSKGSSDSAASSSRGDKDEKAGGSSRGTRSR